ncbi:MAG TPA: DNA adenine methylase [Longimicrobiales bacterium]
MRYLGNKTRLLGFIRDVLRRRGIGGGVAVDPFTGTASVASALKRWGFRVVAADIMEFAHVFGRAYVQTATEPCFSALADELDGHPPTLAGVIAYLDRLPPEPGFLHEHFTPGGEEGRRHGRMYFTPANAARIDAIRATLQRWRADGRLDDDGFHLLLAALIEAADRVANTAGVYAACIKSWQPNARRPLRLRTPRFVPGAGCRALRGDARAIVDEHEPFDLLYIDPPYNTRQYPAYYHIPELIAVGWFDGPVRLRGKTGLLPDQDKRSDWSRRSRCAEALEELVASARCRHIVMSYNTEGIIPEETIARVLKRYGRAGTYAKYRRRYRRYRSDADGAHRTYRGDEVHEVLYCVSR